MRTPDEAEPAPADVANASNEPLLRAQGLSKTFVLPSEKLFGKRRGLHAVSNVDLWVHAGETVSVVGESGSGKSTLGRLLLRLIDPTAGQIHYSGRNITVLDAKGNRSLRRDMQMIFQNPYSSLNPRKTIRAILRQPLLVHGIGTRQETDRRVMDLLESVGLDPPSLYLDRYPHELSGGQRQRVGVARAISVEPQFIVADEPLSALDMSVQAQILRLLVKLRDELGLAYLMITHDLIVARSLSDRIVVLYLGKIVEQGPVKQIFGEARHPYTLSLLAATPVPDPDAAQDSERIRLRGEIPSPIDPPSGCPFHTRCPFVQPERCLDEVPKLHQVGDQHVAACHYTDEIASGQFRPWEYTPPSQPPTEEVAQ